jgi:hypothetical protein
MQNISDEIYDKIGYLDSTCQRLFMGKKVEQQTIVDEEVMNPLWDDIFTEIHNNIQTNLHNAEFI